jgi:hypothetical protein
MKVRIVAVVIGALLGAGVLGATVANAAPRGHSAPADWGSPAPVGTPTTH